MGIVDYLRLNGMEFNNIIDTITAKPYYRDESVVIYHSDNRLILPLIPDQSIDLVLTDPPYGIGVNRMTLGNGKRLVYRGEYDWDKEIIDLSPLLNMNVPTVIWGGNYFPLPLSRGWLVWDKGTGDNDYADCELAWSNRDGVIKKYFRSWVGANAKEKTEADRYHPTQKPVALMEWCINFFPEAIMILDPFMGGGSTLRASLNRNRKCIGIEIEEKYCEIAAQRCSQSVMRLEV